MKKLLASLALLALSQGALAGGYVGDYAPGDTVDCDFGTVQPSTGASFTLGGTPSVAVYKDNSTTESTTGVTLTVDFDAQTGANHVRVTTGSDGTFYSAGSFFAVKIAAGTVDSVLVVGQPVCSFTLNKVAALRPTVAGRTADVTAGGAVGIDAANVEITNGSPVFGIPASGTLSGTHTSTVADLGTNAPGATSQVVGMTLVIPSKVFAAKIDSYNTTTGEATFSPATGLTLTDGDAWYLFATAQGAAGLTQADVRSAVGLATASLDTQLGGIQTDTNDIQSRLPASLLGGRMDSSTGAMAAGVLTPTAIAADAFTAAKFAPDVTTEIQAGLATAASLAALTNDIGADGAGLVAIPWNAAWDAEVQSEALDALNALTLSEPTAKPSWSSTFPVWFAWVAAWTRNEINQTATQKILRNDADNANIVTCAVSDDGTTFSLQECAP